MLSDPLKKRINRSLPVDPEIFSTPARDDSRPRIRCLRLTEMPFLVFQVRGTVTPSLGISFVASIVVEEALASITEHPSSEVVWISVVSDRPLGFFLLRSLPLDLFGKPSFTEKTKSSHFFFREEEKYEMHLAANWDESKERGDDKDVSQW